MSSIQETDFYKSLQVDRQNRQKEDAGKRNELGKDEFMRLLLAQLEHQDPLQPTDNGEFIAQMAQFSSLEGIQSLNSTVENFSYSLQSSQALQASTLVGRSVQIKSEWAQLKEGQPVKGTLDLQSSSGDVFVAVYSAQGEYLGDINLGQQPAGQVTFEWNGLDADGEPFEDGIYQFRAYASKDGQHEGIDVYLSHNVDSVSLNSGPRGEIMLNISGMDKAIPLRDVIAIN